MNEALNMGHLLGTPPIDANDPVASPDAKIRFLAGIVNDLTSGALAVSGTRAAPSSLVAGTSIPVTADARRLLFVKGSGGPVTITANPRIAPGTTVGQELLLKGTSDTDTVTLANGNGLELNGAVVLKAGSILTVVWDGTAWGEVSRNDL